MVKRTCPLCGKTWLSSVSQEDWTCQNCGFLLTTDLNRNVKKFTEVD